MFRILLAGYGMLLVAGCKSQMNGPVVDRLSQLRAEVRLHPRDPAAHYFLAYYEARQGDTLSALSALRHVADLGFDFVPTAAEFPALAHSASFEQILSDIDARTARVSGAPVAFTIAERRLAPEGLALDTISGAFFVGSVAQHRILRIASDGAVTDFSRPTDGLHSVLGLHIDAARRRLFAVTTNAFSSPPRAKLVNEVVAYDLAQDRRVDSWRVAQAGALNDVVRCGNQLFVSDIELGTVWRIEMSTRAVAPLVPVGAFYGANGVAVSADCRLLYLAHNLGIVAVSTSSGHVTPLANPRGDNLAAIDGLYRWQHWLIGVQSVTTPGRVVAARLDSTGYVVDSVVTLQSHHNPAFETPTTGAVGREAFFVLARTQIGLFDAATGRFSDSLPLRPPAVLRLPVPEATPSAVRERN